MKPSLQTVSQAVDKSTITTDVFSCISNPASMNDVRAKICSANSGGSDSLTRCLILQMMSFSSSFYVTLSNAVGRYDSVSSGSLQCLSIAMILAFIINGGKLAVLNILLQNFNSQILARFPKCLMNSGYIPSSPAAFPTSVALIASFSSSMENG